MRFVVCYPGTKIPIGTDWAANWFDAEEMKKRHANNPAANFGVLLGPDDGIDVETDSEEGATVYAQHFVGIVTPTWQSTRRRHHFLRHDPRLVNLASVVKWQGIEFRLGNGKQLQSIVPPSIVDGVKREWLVPPDVEPAPLPEPVIQALLGLTPAAQRHRKSTAIPAIQRAMVDRLCRYARRGKLGIAAVREGWHGCVFIDLVHCIFSDAGSERGAPAFVVFPDGEYRYLCFHPDHAGKTWADVEEAFGPLFPAIQTGLDLERTIQESIQALMDDPTVMQRGPLVQIVYDPPRPKQCLVDGGSPRIVATPKAILRARLSSAAHYYRFQAGKGWVPCAVPNHVVDAVLQAPAYDGIPSITGVVSCPILRADGTIAHKAGFDRETGLWLDVDGDYPDLPNVKEAVEMLKDFTVDFPFANEQHRAAAIAMPVTFVSRHAFGGPVPLGLADGNRSGVGKGLYIDGTTMIIEGRPATRYGYPSDSEELRKVLTTVIMSGAPYVVFDNVKGKLGGPILEKVLTDARWSDRLLGLNREIDLPVTHVTLATGNNCRLTPDMPRRTLYCRLESLEEDPSKRTGFKHSPFLNYVKQNRHQLVMACLAIPYHYMKAGRPDQRLPAWGSFQAWSDLVRNALVWAGFADPDTRDTLAVQVDDESALLAAVMEAWCKPMTVAEAIDLAERGTADPDPIESEKAMKLWHALEELPRGEKRKHALGQLLKNHKGRVVNGRRFERTDCARPKWQVVSIGVTPSGGSPA